MMTSHPPEHGQDLTTRWLSQRVRRGFALVITLMLMVLLTLVEVGLLSLSAIT